MRTKTKNWMSNTFFIITLLLNCYGMWWEGKHHDWQLTLAPPPPDGITSEMAAAGFSFVLWQEVETRRPSSFRFESPQGKKERKKFTVFVYCAGMNKQCKQILSLRRSLQVVVHITDENDCTPEFLQSIYTRDNLPESTAPGSSLLQGNTHTHTQHTHVHNIHSHTITHTRKHTHRGWSVDMGYLLCVCVRKPSVMAAGDWLRSNSSTSLRLCSY